MVQLITFVKFVKLCWNHIFNNFESICIIIHMIKEINGKICINLFVFNNKN